jgi:hypothetical protein
MSADAAERELNVKRPISEKALKKAYRAAAMRTHPDRGGTQDAFLRTQEAYAVLRRHPRPGDGDDPFLRGTGAPPPRSPFSGFSWHYKDERVPPTGPPFNPGQRRRGGGASSASYDSRFGFEGSSKHQAWEDLREAMHNSGQQAAPPPVDHLPDLFITQEGVPIQLLGNKSGRDPKCPGCAGRGYWIINNPAIFVTTYALCRNCYGTGILDVGSKYTVRWSKTERE